MASHTVTIGAVGDFNPQSHTHAAILPALDHSAATLGALLSVNWISTPELQVPGSEAMLEQFDGLIAAPGSPYRSFEGMLRAIEFARTRDWPFTAT